VCPSGWPDRVDGHRQAFAAHMREGLLAVSTAMGLDVMVEHRIAVQACLAEPFGVVAGERHQVG
jgi:hypothetical protein